MKRGYKYLLTAAIALPVAWHVIVGFGAGDPA